MLAAKISILGNVIAAVLFSLIISGCIDVDEKELVSEAGEICEDIIDEKLEEAKNQIIMEAWDTCTSFYEDTLIPLLKAELNMAQEQLIQQIKDELKAEYEAKLEQAGCIRDDSLFGWDCSQSDICLN